MHFASILLALSLALISIYVISSPQTAIAAEAPASQKEIHQPQTACDGKLTASVLSYTNILSSDNISSENITEAIHEVPLTIEEETQLFTAIYTLGSQEDRFFTIQNYAVEDIHFSDESWAGYIIEFTTSQENGYAIFFYIENNYHLIELRFGTFSPYFGKDGMYIYPAIGYYIIKQNGQYYNAENMGAFTFTATEDPIFYAACGGDYRVPYTRTIPFRYSGLYEYAIPDFHCNYSTSLTSNTNPNNCANAAGVIMLNYWNKKYDNNILNLDASEMINGNMNDSAAIQYMNIFYDYMNTNWIFGTGGTLPDDCYNGFKRLIEEKGRTISIEKNLNFDNMMSQLSSGRPIFITSTDYYFTQSTSSPLPVPVDNTSLTINYYHYSGLANAHTFVAYGYSYYHLQFEDGSVQREELLKIADGWGNSRYFNYTISGVYSNAAVVVLPW